MKIPQGEHVMIYDTLDGAVQPIKIVITKEGSIGIEADRRFGIVRSNATNKTPSKTPTAKGGTDARPMSA